MDVARFVRIFEPDPSDDFVTKRTAAIRQLKTQFLKQRNVGKLMSLATETFGVFQEPPVVPESYAEVIEGAIKKQSESFVRDGRDLEMSVCAMIAVIHAIQGSDKASEGWTVADVLATAVWSGASFLPANPEPKLEEFRSQTVDAAKQRILESSLDTRVRRNVPEFGAFGDEQLGAEAFGEATGATIDALQYNAALDREELDMLWWVLGDTSNVLEKPMVSLSPETRAITSGIELGELLRALPSQSHRNLCARGVGETESMTLPAVLEALGACAVEVLMLGDWRAAAGEVGFWPECGHLARPTLGWKSQTGRPERKRFAFHTRSMGTARPGASALAGQHLPQHVATVPIRLMFNAKHTRSHSPRTFAKPRRLNRRNPSTSLIHPFGASESHLRCAYRALPAGRASFSPMRCVAGSRAGSTATWDLPSRPSATCASMPRSSSSNRSGSLQ